MNQEQGDNLSHEGKKKHEQATVEFPSMASRKQLERKIRDREWQYQVAKILLDIEIYQPFYSKKNMKLLTKLL